MRKFLSSVRIGSPLSKGQAAAIFASFEKRELRILQFIAMVRAFVSSFTAREASLGGISSPVDFLPSRDFNSFATSSKINRTI